MPLSISIFTSLGINDIYNSKIHFTFVYMLNAICITTNQLVHIQTNLCIHLSYLEDQRNLKIYNKNIFKKEGKKGHWSLLKHDHKPSITRYVSGGKE